MEIKVKKSLFSFGRVIIAVMLLHVVSFCWLRFLAIAKEQAAEAANNTLADFGYVRPQAATPDAPELSPIEYLREQARRYVINPSLVVALAECESGFQQNAKSEKGALGIMQVMPQTAKLYGWDGRISLTDPFTNIDFGTVRFADALREVKGNPEQAVWHYHAGPNGVKKILSCGERNWKCLGTEYSKSVRHADCVLGKLARDAGQS